MTRVGMAVKRPSGRIVIGALTAESLASSGIQRYSGEILAEMLTADSAARALVASAAVAATHGDRARLLRPALMSRGNFGGNLTRLAWHQLALPRLLRREGAGIFYSTVPDGMVTPTCPQVVTIHDLIPLLHPPSAPRLQHYFRHVVPRIAHASDAIIAMSQATKRDLERLYGVSGERVHVVHQGYRASVFNVEARDRSAEARARFALRRYLLATADGRSYKNIPRVLEAFSRLRQVDVQLALLGRTSRREVDLPALAGKLGIQERVHFLGPVTDQDLAALFAGAEAFVFPSMYEGFGIPPLEAMACGCPVIASDRTSLPEVCGDAAVYVDPYHVEAIVEAMERVVADSELRSKLRVLGPKRAVLFSYRRAAGEILSVLRGVSGIGGGERR